MNYQQTRDSFPFVNVGNVYVGKILNDCGRVEVIFLLKSHIVRNYGHMRFVNPQTNTGLNFIRHWLLDPTIDYYQRMDMYPRQNMCPENVYNLWTPFHMDVNRPLCAYKSTGIEMVLRFIRILCNGSGDVVIDWLKDMIRFPWRKYSKLIFLVGEPGCGKSVLGHLLYKILGSKYARLSNERRMYTPLMVPACLLHFGEDGLWTNSQISHAVKSLISDESVTVHLKGIGSFEMNSFHRVLITANRPDSAGLFYDRRTLPIQCGSELVGGHKYFQELNTTINDDSFLSSFWDYLKGPSWARVRQKLRARSIVLYWLDLTKQLMERGATAFARDHA